MSFAQFYYDPAVEFERMLDEDGTAIEASPAAVIGGGPSHIAGGGLQGNEAAVATKSGEAGGAIARSTSMSASETPSQEGRRWFGEGLLKRCASTGSVNGGTHPGIPK